MPTGYTSRIEDGATFEEFILNCAKAFGACISMRDEPMSKPIPEKFKETSFYKERYEEAVSKLKDLEKMSFHEAEKLAEAEYLSEVKRQKEFIDKIDKIENLYEEMLIKVNEWTPPSTEHLGLKKFMIEQIDISMDKGSMRGYYDRNKPIKLNGTQWLFNQIQKVKENIKYHMEEWVKETERNNSKNEWIQQLRDSII